MIKILNAVLRNESRILQETSSYEQKVIQGMSTVQDRNELTRYFNNFTEDEIMIIQSIMYLGRDCYPDNSQTSFSSIDKLLEEYLTELEFVIGKSIQKDIEINQMVEKGLKIGRYFDLGFKEVHKYI